MNGADAIARALRDAGVDVAFGLPGVHNMAFWPAFEAAGIRIVGSRHEQGCAYAADGYARATGKVGVALVTTGPGAANTLGAVGEAWASKSPVLVIATDIPSTLREPGVYRGVLHECTDQAGMFAPVTKVQTRDLAEAMISTRQGVHGPAYFEIPTNELSAPAAPFKIPRVGTIRNLPAFTMEVGSRPVVWVGGGARFARAAIDQIARHLGAPVVTTYSARGVLPAGHPHLVPAPAHEPQVTELIAQGDSTVVIGSDLDAMNTMNWKLPLPRPRIAINIDPKDATKNYEFDQVIKTSAMAAHGALHNVTTREPWFGDLAALGRTIRDDIRNDPNTTESIAFLEHTEAAIPHDHVLYADMCIAGYWLAGHFAVHRERGLHYPMGWGTLGWAFPAAIGSAAAGKPTVTFIGDGGMLFALGELATVAQEHLPLTIVVVDDGGYGMLRFPHATATGCELNSVDFVAVAESFGIPAVRVDGVGPEYEHALRAATDRSSPALIHLKASLYPPRTTSPRWPMK